MNLRPGIMQGRLSDRDPARPQAFPWATWEAEPARAAACGFASLEWLYAPDRLEDNPLLHPAGRARIAALARESGTPIRSVCAHALIDGGLAATDPTPARARLGALLAASAALGVEVVVLPVLEQASLHDPAIRAGTAASLRAVLPPDDAGGPRVALEADLAADDLLAFLADVGRPALGVCYDVGNATAAGLSPPDELWALRAWLLEVHLKDRPRGGASRPLGAGDVPFAAVGACLRALRFSGPLVLETPTEPAWEEAARANLAFARRHLEDAA